MSVCCALTAEQLNAILSTYASARYPSHLISWTKPVSSSRGLEARRYKRDHVLTALSDASSAPSDQLQPGFEPPES